MAWHSLTDAEFGAPIGTRIDIKRTGVCIVVGVTNNDGHREVVA